MNRGYIIAIDGPSSSGKGTIAELIAEQLGFIYLDTGAMYRALTYYCLKNNVDLSSEEAILNALLEIDITFTQDGKTFLNGEDVSQEIRTNEVSRFVSEVISVFPKVREQMVEKQRRYAANHKIVVDGRDIGTVVFPQADIKLFITASLKERARRRYEQNIAKGIDSSLEETENMLAYRDRTDIGRVNSPLLLAKDSIVIDSTNLGIDETLAQAMKQIKI